MDQISMLQRTLDGASAMIHQLRPTDLTRPTPCSEWDVRGLLDHMVGVCAHFTDALTDDPSASDQPTDLLGDDPAAGYDRQVQALLRGWRQPGVFERTLKLRLGELPARLAIGIVTADQLLHTWDLARALDRPHTIDPDLAEASLELMRGILKPEFRGPGRAFAEAVACPEDAPIQDRLLAFAGRQP